jgi:hypothetical protein
MVKRLNFSAVLLSEVIYNYSLKIRVGDLAEYAVYADFDHATDLEAFKACLECLPITIYSTADNKKIILVFPKDQFIPLVTRLKDNISNGGMLATFEWSVSRSSDKIQQAQAEFLFAIGKVIDITTRFGYKSS